MPDRRPTVGYVCVPSTTAKNNTHNNEKIANGVAVVVLSFGPRPGFVVRNSIILRSLLSQKPRRGPQHHRTFVGGADPTDADNTSIIVVVLLVVVLLLLFL